MLLLLIFGMFPAGYAIWESFDVTSATQTSTVGLGNFAKVFSDFRFLPALGNVATFILIWVPIMMVGTIALALLLHERIGRLSTTLRLIYFLPGAVTGSAAVLLWYFMLDPSISPFSPALHALGFNTTADVFRAPNLPWIYALVAFSTGVGQWVVIMFGAFQGVPAELIEAARVDGAGPVRIAIQVKLPLIQKYVVYMLILTFAGATQIFVEPALFYSASGAGSNWWSLNQLGYSFAFNQGDFGQSATVSVVLLVVSAVGAALLVFRTRFFSTTGVEQ